MSELRKVIAVDFDGCLCHNAFPEIGAPHWDVIAKARQEQKDGAGLILWTCREGRLLQEAIEACSIWGLEFDAVNDSLPEWIKEYGNSPRKVGATEYWDDRAVPVCCGYLCDRPKHDEPMPPKEERLCAPDVNYYRSKTVEAAVEVYSQVRDRVTKEILAVLENAGANGCK